MKQHGFQISGKGHTLWCVMRQDLPQSTVRQQLWNLDWPQKSNLIIFVSYLAETFASIVNSQLDLKNYICRLAEFWNKNHLWIPSSLHSESPHCSHFPVLTPNPRALQTLDKGHQEQALLLTLGLKLLLHLTCLKVRPKSYKSILF